MSHHWQEWIKSKRAKVVFVMLLLFGVALGYAHIGAGRKEEEKGLQEAKIRRALNEAILGTIKEGMTKEQVVALIGGPSGAYNRYPVICRPTFDSWEEVLCSSYDTETWTGDEGEIVVCFDSHGCVHAAFFRVIYCDSRSLLERLLDYVRRRIP